MKSTNVVESKFVLLLRFIYHTVYTCWYFVHENLLRSHLQDLKDVTHNVHYENYRVGRLNESNINFSSELGLPTWMLENGHNDKSKP